MAISKALILQGILGVAGLCASSAGGIGLGLEKVFLGVKGDQDSVDDSSPKPEAAEITEVVKEDDLGIPKECDTSCSLTAEQLKKLKFEVKDNEEIKFEGLNDSDEFELKIEVSEDLINYPRGKKYTLRPKTIGGTVTIKNIKEGDISLENSKEVLIREVIGGGKLEHLLEEINGLGIPKRCEGEEAIKTCELTQQQLEKLKFETKDGEKISVEGLGEGNIVTLKIEDKGNDGNNYPRGKKYTLRSASGEVTIKGVKDGDITLGAEEVLIREIKGGGRLEHLIEEVDRLGIPKGCNADGVSGGTPKTCELKLKQLRDLRFEAKEGTSILVEGQSEGSTFELIIENKPDDKDDYPKGKKYTLRSKTGKVTIKNVEEGDITLWGGQSVVIREAEGGDKFEMAPEEVDELGIPESCNSKKICNITAEQIKKLQFERGEESSITVENLPKGKTVTLKVEDKPNDEENYPKGKKYILSAKSGQQVTIKGFSDGDITIEKGGVVIREKIVGSKLEIAPEEIDRLGIPRRCKSGSTCDLTKGQLEKFKFETNPGSSIAVIGLGEGKKVELRVETPSDLTDYPKGKKYTLTAKSGTVTIQNVKDGNIEIGTEEGFVIRGKREVDKLEKVPKEFNELGIPRWCKGDEVLKTSDTRSCELPQKQLKSLKFKAFEEGSDEVKVDGLSESDKIKLTISWSEDQNNYPDNKKYSFDNTKGEKDITITKGGQTVTIEKLKESRFKNDGDKLSLVAAMGKDQMAKENKLRETNEILKKLGLEGLSIGDFTDSNSTRHEQTKIEFSNKNESDLKKIKFKDLGGGATWVTSLGGWSIKVFLDWDASFPNNMKFTFLNQNFSPFEFKNGNRSVKIPQKTSGVQTPTFKVENYQLVKVS